MFEVISVEFYDNVKKIINESRKHVVTYVNTTMLFTYWNIGKMIIEEQGGSSKAKYGNKLIAELSKQMTLDFGKGFDERNLRKMRQFYLMYPIWDSVRPELTWTHYRTLIRIEEQYIRSFYMEEAIKSNWSVRQLERQIDTCAYSRVIAYNSEVEKFENIEEVNDVLKYDPNTVIKDPYMLEFLGLDNNAKYLEKELEDALITHLQKFLQELGRGFCFVARQKRISFDNDVSVVLKIDKNGRVTAEFIPGSIEVENYLRNNIDSLKQKFEEQNLPYNDLFYRQNNRQQNKKQNKENKGEK